MVMQRGQRAVFVFGVTVAFLAGCEDASRPIAPGARTEAQAAIPPAPDFPQRGPGQVIEPGIVLEEVTLGPPWAPGRTPGQSGKLWLYLPEGTHEARSLPCVLIAGAGSTLLTGMNLGEGDRAEHLPWVRAGFAVLAYELDGELPDSNGVTTADLVACARGFLGARAGHVNARNALKYLETRVPEVDGGRIFAVGHSSAGTVALLIAELEPGRIRACAAFSPGTYSDASGRPRTIRELSSAVPRVDDLLRVYNPQANAERIGVPVFLFTPEDDANVPASETKAFARALEGLGKSVTLEVVPSGGHYDAMVNEGIPRAIAWAKTLGSPRLAQSKKR